MKALLLAAGLGTRLHPLTEIWPKCLMPIHGRPLLEYWLGISRQQGIRDVLVNIHHHPDIMDNFLRRPRFRGWVESAYEPALFGTAGTLRKNANFFREDTVLMAHADNWSCCDFSDFISYHYKRRPQGTVITMMTFDCDNPSSCGIVELDQKGVVHELHEKVENPPGKLANAAVYILEPEVLKWLKDNPNVSDFSNEVIPYYLGRISTWKNKGVHRDIGTIESLKKAQKDDYVSCVWENDDVWQEVFSTHDIHLRIQGL